MLAIHGGEPHKKKNFPGWPIHSEREIKLLEEVVKSGNWWRITGSKVKEFEEKFSSLQGTEYCLGVTSGTHAIELGLLALGIEKGDEVIVPAFTYISTVTAVISCSAVPVLVDVDPETFCMRPEAFEKAITKKTKAVIPVHMGGHPCDMDFICDIARKNDIYIIEDSAHGHGAEWKNRRLGSMGDLGIFSFQNGKLMTCGEGGCIVTNDKQLHEKLFLMHGVGRPDKDPYYQHYVLGTTARMSEFHAAILIAQMERVNELNQKREKQAKYLDQLLEQIDGIRPQMRKADATIVSHYMYMFYYDADAFRGMPRQEFIDALRAEGIPSFISYPVLSDTEFFKNSQFFGKIDAYSYDTEEELPNARKIAKEVVWLPHYTLEGDVIDLEEIAGAITKIQKSL